MLKVQTLPRTCGDIGEILSTKHAEEKSENRDCLKKILSSIRFLARQGLSFRGDGDESDGNYIQILKFRGEDDSRMIEWLKRKNEKYTCADAQNEMIQIMALSILRDVAKNIRNSVFYSIMADETTDISNREQFVLVLRHVDEKLVAHEEYIGLYKVASIDSDSLTKTIEDCLLRMNLSLNNCRGQCYDGASNMSGCKNGVSKQISDKEPKAIYTHCYGHALNLAVGDTMKQSKIMRDALDTTYEMSKLVKFSPKRDSLLEKLKQELAPDTPGFRTLCPTRWTVRADSLQSVLDNYEVLQDLWEESYSEVRDTDIRARIKGVDAQMKTFDYLFGVMLGQSILRHTDNLSKGLQHETLAASEGQSMAQLTLDTLARLRNDESFNKFYQDVKYKAETVDVNEPSLPRKRKMPKRFQSGDAAHFFPQTESDMFRHKYFEALDLVTNCVKTRFDQPGFKVFRNVEELLVKGVQTDFGNYCDEFSFVTEFYKTDIKKDALKVQLETMRTYFERQERDDIRLNDIVDYLRILEAPMRAIYSEVVTLVRILLVIPATNATSERTFSALRRIKTYLRSTMTQARLNHLITLHVHKDRTDSLNLTEIANEFTSRNEKRKCVFGKF